MKHPATGLLSLPHPRTLSLAVGLFVVSTFPLQALEVRSPDGTLKVTVDLKNGAPTYQVSLREHQVLEPSPLGLETNLGSFANDLKEAGSETGVIDEHYTLPHGKVSEVHYQANELKTRFTNGNGGLLEVIFRVSNRDVAFSYKISAGDKARVVVSRERTGFNFPSAATAFVSPQVPWGGGYMATKPSYEESYLLDVPVGTPSPSGLGFTFPALFRVGSDRWVLVSETGVSGNYAGCRLGEPNASGEYPVSFPEAAENAGIGEASVSAALPLQTPWRTLTVGDTLAPIVESTVATDVVTPLYKATTNYKPGRATWSWLLWQDASMNEADQRTFIDLAARLGYEYILVDALWDVNLGRKKLEELVAYAASKSVGVLLWYNSNGSWNDAPQTPRHCLDSAPARQKEMAWLQSIGVKGLKVDFFGGDKQATMKLYEDILTEGNAHGLMLNFHGATLPRGWERMYPNHMTSEAVTASENLVFSQGFADKEANNSTLFSFIRNPVAAMDYGPLVLNKTFARDDQHGNKRRTSDAFQLATTVLYQSPLQHFGLTPDSIDAASPFVVEFLKRVPARWDDIAFLGGYPGKWAALARRSGDKWYVAATNGDDTRRAVTLNVPQFAGKEVRLIHDGEDRAATESRIAVPASGNVELTLEVGGGAVLFQ